jgi:hypothetical protein
MEMPNGCAYCGQKPSFGLTVKRGCQMHGDPIQHVILKCKNVRCPAQPQIKGGDIYLWGETGDGLAKGKRLAREEAIRIWNTRADTAILKAKDAEISELKEQVELFKGAHQGAVMKGQALSNCCDRRDLRILELETFIEARGFDKI